MSERTEHLLRELTAVIREEVGALPANILTLGEEVAIARQHSRMSLQEVADASGFTKSHVWEVEKGRSRNPTIGMVSGLSKALGVPFLRLAQAALNSSEAPALSGAQRSELSGQLRDEQSPSPSTPKAGDEGLSKVGIANFLRDWAYEHFGKRIFHTTAHEAAEAILTLTAGASNAEGSEEFIEFKEALSDLRSLRAEHDALNGGGPGWAERHRAAWAKVDELFADEDEAAYQRQQEDFYG